MIEVDSFFGKIKIPDGYLVLKCEFCQMNIGTFKPEDVSTPVDASMFESIDKAHEAPHPFNYIPGRTDTLNWEYLNCPVCGVRVFVDFNTNKQKTHIMTPFGQWEIGLKNIPGPKNLTTMAERNQEEINRIWKAEKERSAQEVVSKVMDMKDVGPENQENAEAYDKVLKKIKKKAEEPPVDKLEAFRKKYPGRCQFCGKDCKIPMARGNHEKACPDNPINEKKEDKEDADLS